MAYVLKKVFRRAYTQGPAHPVTSITHTPPPTRRMRRRPSRIQNHAKLASQRSTTGSAPLLSAELKPQQQPPTCRRRSEKAPKMGSRKGYRIQLSIFVRGCDMVCYGRFRLLVAGHSVPIHPTSTTGKYLKCLRSNFEAVTWLTTCRTCLNVPFAAT